VLNQDYVANTRVVRPLELTFHYNDYDFDDLTRQLLFPGYAAYGNSFWRTTRYGQPASAPQNPAGDVDVPIERNPKSFRRQRVLLQGVLKPVRDLTWKTEYRWDLWHRENRPVRELTESGITSSIAYAPRGPAYLNAGFSYLDRTPTAYDPGHLENLYLRMFDEARRIRTQGNAMFSVDLARQVVFSGSWYYTGDRYDKRFYGLHQQKSNGLSADLSFDVSENFAFFAGYGYDRIGYDYLLSASLGYLWVNSWSRDTRDRVHSVHMGLSGSIGQTKLNYSFSYGLTLARTLINTVNPNTVQPDALDYSRAYPFPVVKSQLSELRADASYQLSKRIRTGFSFLFEPFHLGDFAYDAVSPYNPASFAPETDTRRYLFTGSGPTSYTGKLLAVYIRYSF
jgi:Putative outer membrane beta-barrel porin, MtrB/PioB